MERIVNHGLVCRRRNSIRSHRLSGTYVLRPVLQGAATVVREECPSKCSPLLLNQLQTYQDLKSIILRNDGVGPAVVTAATFTKNGRSTNRLVELFDVPIPSGRCSPRSRRGGSCHPKGRSFSSSNP